MIHKRSMTVKMLIMVLCLSLFLPGGIGAFASSVSAKVLSIEGQVQVVRAGGERPFNAFVNMRLTEGDRIITGTDGTAQIEMDDEIIITLAPNTRIYLSELRGSNGAQQSSVGLQAGGVGSSVKKKVEGSSRFEIKTPTAVMGVRGTEFFTQYNNGEVDVRVITGSVGVTASLFGGTPPAPPAPPATPGAPPRPPAPPSLEGMRVVSFTIQANQQARFNERSTPDELLAPPEPLSLEGLDTIFIDRVAEIALETPDIIPESIRNNIPEARQQAEQRAQDRAQRSVVPDELFVFSGVGPTPPGPPQNIIQAPPPPPPGTAPAQPPPSPVDSGGGDSGSGETTPPTVSLFAVGFNVELLGLDPLTYDEFRIVINNQTVILTETVVDPDPLYSGSIQLANGTYSFQVQGLVHGGDLDVWESVQGGNGSFAVEGSDRSVIVQIIGQQNPMPGAVVSISKILQAGSHPTATASTVENGAGGWDSSNPVVATIDAQTGVITAVSAGTTTISYTTSTSGNVNHIEVEVYPAPSDISGALRFSDTSTTIATGTKQLTGFTEASPGQTGTFAVSDSSTDVITVDGGGLITYVGSGTKTVTYTLVEDSTGRVLQSGGVEITATAIVPGAVVSISGPLQLGLNTTATASSAEPGAGGWQSSNTGVATINASTGVITALEAGTATISYTTSNSGNVNHIEVEVYPAPSDISGALRFSDTSTTIATGTKQLTGFTEESSGQTGTFAISDGTTDVITVNPSGEVSYVADGTKRVTYALVENATGRVIESGNVDITARINDLMPPTNLTGGTELTKASLTIRARISSGEITIEYKTPGEHGNSIRVEIISTGNDAELSAIFESALLTIDLKGQERTTLNIVDSIDNLYDFTAVISPETESELWKP